MKNKLYSINTRVHCSNLEGVIIGNVIIMAENFKEACNQEDLIKRRLYDTIITKIDSFEIIGVNEIIGGK